MRCGGLSRCRAAAELLLGAGGLLAAGGPHSPHGLGEQGLGLCAVVGKRAPGARRSRFGRACAASPTLGGSPSPIVGAR